MKRREFAARVAAIPVAVAVATMLAAPLALAQDHTTRILVGFPPGGSADVVARLLAEKMRVSLGQNVIIDNKPGAAGRLALAEVKRAAPKTLLAVLRRPAALQRRQSEPTPRLQRTP